jgi:hypothetical protein
MTEDGALRVRATYRLHRVEVDVVAAVRALGRPAADAARALLTGPGDAAAVEAFGRAVRAPGAPPVGCDVVVGGDGGITYAYRVGTARLDLAALLAGSDELTGAFAEQLAATRGGGDRRPFDDALSAVVRPEHLGAVAARLPGRSPVLVLGPGRADAIDTRYRQDEPADAARAADDVDEDDDWDAQAMYDALERTAQERGGQPLDRDLRQRTPQPVERPHAEPAPVQEEHHA